MLPKNSISPYVQPYRDTSRTKHTKPRKTTQNLFKLIHNKEKPDDACGKKVA